MCVQSVCREAARSQRLPAVQRPREAAHHEGNTCLQSWPGGPTVSEGAGESLDPGTSP